MPRSLLLSLLFMVALCPSAHAANVTPRSGEVLTLGSDSALTPYGVLGKWMLAADKQPARWLDYRLGQRAMREPINVVLIDKAATSPQDAAARLLGALEAAGYSARKGHSDGYQGLIGTQLYAQYPLGKGEAFSDGAWWQSNNHGRVFGPALLGSAVGPAGMGSASGAGYAWTASFSREDFVVVASMHHPYSSFKVARDDFSARLDALGPFKKVGSVNLQNALNTPALTTDDHDGQAVVLVADK